MSLRRMLLIGVTKQRRPWVKGEAQTPTYQISYPNIGVPIDGQQKYLNNIALHHQPHIIVHLYGIIKRTKTPNDPGILFFPKKNNIYCQHF
jgi:hypothetical protein